jgi:hypothetical protein
VPAARGGDPAAGPERARPGTKLLAIALVAQIAVGGAFAYVASQGFPTFGGGTVTPRFGRAALGPTPIAKVDRFNAKHAFLLLKAQVAVGQRPAGSAQLRTLADRLVKRLPGGRFEDVPGHPGLRNIVGTIPGRRPALLIGAHYDTEYHPPGFVGANDSAAGTAAVLELARTLQRAPRPKGSRELRFVLFDGEEEPPGTPPGADAFFEHALRGSKAYATAHKGEVGSMVLLDYIANRGVRFLREEGSTPALWSRLRSAAKRVGVLGIFPDETQQGIIDDHVPFTEQGVPAIDLIDFSYQYADTVRDSLDKVTVRDLDATGEAVLELLRTERVR